MNTVFDALCVGVIFALVIIGLWVLP